MIERLTELSQLFHGAKIIMEVERDEYEKAIPEFQKHIEETYRDGAGRRFLMIDSTNTFHITLNSTEFIIKKK